MAGNDFLGAPNSKLQYCIIAGGNDKDPAENQSCFQKAFPVDGSPIGVQTPHLAFSPLLISPDYMSQVTFPGGLDSATPVAILKKPGETGGVIIGQFAGIHNPDQSGGKSSGGKTILSDSNKVFNTQKQQKRNIRIPPNVEETEENGVKIRKAKEKDKDHSFELTEGLPIHAALFQMAGFRQPEIKNVPTAKQTNDQMLSPEMLQGLPGQIMSLGQMFQGLMGNKGKGGGGGGIPNVPQTNEPANNRLDVIGSVYTNKGTPELATALYNISTLVQGMEVNNGAAFFTGGVVDEATYLQNCEKLLSQANNLSDIMNVLQRLQWDTSLFGQENLANATFTLSTAYGNVSQTLTYAGDIISKYTANGVNQISDFANTITSNTSSPSIGSVPSNGSGGNGGQNNMFGSSANQLMDMFKRLTTQGETNAKQMHETLNSDGESNKLFEIIKRTTQGGNPLEKILYQ